MRAAFSLILAGLAAVPVAAQEPKDTARTLSLTQVMEAARKVGVTDASFRIFVDTLKVRQVALADIVVILQAEVDAVQAGSPKENFGAAVRAQLARGLRGRELAAAIRAEHGRRGIGQGRGRAEDADTGRGRRRP